MSTNRKTDPKTTPQMVCRQWAFGALVGGCVGYGLGVYHGAADVVSVVNGATGAGDASGDAAGTPAGGARAVPLGNTGTTTVEGAR